MEPTLHASLAASVSAWEAFIEDLCLELLDEIGRIPDARLQMVLSVLRLEAAKAVEKFNTPNFENCRNLLLRFSGFDPYPHMHVPRLGLSVVQTQSRLNDILKVRHTFAHGAPIPNLPWLTRYGVSSRLSKKNASEAGSLLDELTKSIEAAASNYLKAAYRVPIRW